MKTSIFIKTYHKDAPWLIYCLRSIARFARGFESVVVVSDAGEPKPPIGTMEQHFTVEVRGSGYLWQQAIKLNADAFCSSDLILYTDADTIFTRPICPEDLIEDGKPVWLYTPYSEVHDDARVRQPMISTFVGQSVEYEFMRRHPFIVTREMLVEIRRFCWRQHGISIDEYALRHPDFSEFNAMGAWAWVHAHDSLAWRKPEEIPTFVHQSWSHSGLTDAIRADLERAVA